MQSLGPTQYTCAAASAFEIRFQCDNITPLGVPVLPLEKITAAKSSGFPVPAKRRVESSLAASAAFAFANGVKVGSTSSRNTSPGSSGSLAFSRNTRDESTV